MHPVRHYRDPYEGFAAPTPTATLPTYVSQHHRTTCRRIRTPAAHAVPAAQLHLGSASSAVTHHLVAQPGPVTAGLDMYASSPCALLNEKDLADFQDVTLGPSHSFRSMVVRAEPDAPSDTCTVGTSFTNLVISKFQQVS
jgi:hypothetical protein